MASSTPGLLKRFGVGTSAALSAAGTAIFQPSKMDKQLEDLMGSPGGNGLGLMVGGHTRRTTQLTRKEILEAYERTPWLRRVAARICQDLASMRYYLLAPTNMRGSRAIKQARSIEVRGLVDKWRRHKLLSSALEEGDLREIENHPYLDIWCNGNEWTDGLQLRKLFFLNWELVGDSPLLLDTNGLGVPSKGWIIPPHWVSRWPTFARMEVEITFPGGRRDSFKWGTPDAEIWWWKDPRPTNPYENGSGTGTAVAIEVETDYYVARHNLNYFFNSARPELLAIFPSSVSEPEVQRIRQGWMQRAASYVRAHTFHALRMADERINPKDVQIHDLSKKLSDLMSTELRENERDFIRQVWGVPPEILGEVNESKRATITLADFIYASRVLLGRAEAKRVFDQRIMDTVYDSRILVEYESPVREDSEFILEVAKALPEVLDANEWRELAGMLPKEELDDLHLVRLNVSPQTAQQMRAMANPPKPPADPTSFPEGDDLEEPEEPPEELEEPAP